MKGKVIIPFIDKDTLKGYNVGKVYESDDFEHLAFLQKEGYLELKEEPKPKRTRKQKAGE